MVWAELGVSLRPQQANWMLCILLWGFINNDLLVCILPPKIFYWKYYKYQNSYDNQYTLCESCYNILDAIPFGLK
jgi:hypothetical protein